MNTHKPKAGAVSVAVFAAAAVVAVFVPPTPAHADVFGPPSFNGGPVPGTVTLQKNLLSSTSTTTNAGTGTCTSVTVSGTVVDFTVTATCTAAQTVITTFSAGFGAAPVCVISSANTAAGAVTTGTLYQSAGASTSATFTFPAVTTGKYNVVCAL